MATDMATDMGIDMKHDQLSVAVQLKLALVTLPLISSAVFAQVITPGSALPQTPSQSAPQPAFLSQDNLGDDDGRAFSIKPRIRLSETWSDNVSLYSGSNSGKESGFITEVAPGVHIDARTERLKGYFDYALSGLFYTKPSGYSQSQNQLNTFGTLEAVSNWLFLDFSGIIAQQAISAFGSQSPSTSNINSNMTETSTYRVSPYIRGQLAGLAEYTVRYNYSTTHANTSNVSDIKLSEWMGNLRGGTPFQSLRWALDASQQTADYSLGRTTDLERINTSLTYTVVPQLRVTATGGQESNNFASADKVTHTTSGYGFDWSPTERTQLSAFKEKRFFGDGHRYSFNHRFPLSSVSYTDTKDVSILPNQFTSIGLGTIYDLFRQICSQQLASQYSDPVQLDIAANNCAANIVPPSIRNTQIVSSFLSSQATILRSQQLALAMQGARNTLTLMFNRNESQNILASGSISNDFFNNGINDIKQRGVSISLSHQLSGDSSANLMASRQESTSPGNAALKANTMLYQGGVSSKIGAKTIGSITVRHSKFDNAITPYTENAIVGTVSVIF